MKEDELALLERQWGDPVLDDLRDFENVTRDIPLKPVNRRMGSPHIFDSASIHVDIGQRHQNAEVITGVEEMDRRATVFEMAIVMPLVLSGAFFLDKEVGPPDKKIIAEMLRQRGLQVVVEKTRP